MEYSNSWWGIQRWLDRKGIGWMLSFKRPLRRYTVTPVGRGLVSHWEYDDISQLLQASEYTTATRLHWGIVQWCSISKYQWLNTNQLHQADPLQAYLHIHSLQHEVTQYGLSHHALQPTIRASSNAGRPPLGLTSILVCTQQLLTGLGLQRNPALEHLRTNAETAW